MKCEVLQDCVIAVQKGSIVEVSQRQFEIARRILKPLDNAKAVQKVSEVETAEEPKAKKIRKN